MFKAKLKKEIPNTIYDCTKTDSVSDQLLRWTDSIDFIGTIIIACNFLAGLAISIILGVAIYNTFDIHWFWPFFIGLIITVVNALIIHLVFQFVTMLFSALASLVLNTRVTADVELYTASKEKEEKNNTGSTNNPTSDTASPVVAPAEPQVITDEATLEEYKKKIDEFLMNAMECTSVNEVLERWEALQLEKHPVVDNINEQIANAASIERMYGKIGKNVEKLLEKVTSYYLMAKFRKEI